MIFNYRNSYNWCLGRRLKWWYNLNEALRQIFYTNRARKRQNQSGNRCASGSGEYMSHVGCPGEGLYFTSLDDCADDLCAS